jgi:hypothetical protein
MPRPLRPSVVGGLLAALTAALLMQLGCGGEVARGRVVAVGRAVQGLTSAEHLSVNGSYGSGCLGRSGPWSLEIASNAVLDHPALSVLRGNLACVLTLTSLHTTSGTSTAAPPIVLSTSFPVTASAFGTPLEFYAAAALDDVSFGGNFVLTLLYSDDASVANAIYTAIPQPPTVIANTPLDGAVNVTIAQRPTAKFSVEMDSSTLTALTFTVQQDLTPVLGAVTYDPGTRTATFTPSAALGLDLVYDATLSTGAKNVRHTPLTSSYSWTFTTSAISQGPVYLFSAASFVVLSGSTITNTGVTSLGGDLGVSPGTMIMGFPPGIITGTRHLGDSIAVQAQADLTTAYNEAAGRSVGSVLTTGDLGGRVLKPGLYTSATSLELTSGDLTLDADGEVDAIFLFQMGSTLTTDPSRKVILIDSAQAANVFWQVGSSATIGTSSDFVGTILADTSITITSGATLNGRALAQSGSVTLNTNAIDRPTP